MHYKGQKYIIYKLQELPPESGLKGNTEYYIGQNSDKVFNEGVFTIYTELDTIKRSLRELIKPNGTRYNPARTCYDLFLCNPDFIEGMYWIDPNLGSPDDAVEVYCSKPGCSCIDCRDTSLSAVDKREKAEVRNKIINTHNCQI